MKILLTHSDPELAARESIDLWRIIRPFRELSKHVDWQIDHQPYLIDHKLISKKTSRVDTEKLIKEIERLNQYDIIWTSYFPDSVLFDCMMFASTKFGTKFVLDVDDDMYHIPQTNPIWRDKKATVNIQHMQYTIENTPYLVTSSPILKASYGARRSNPTYLLPNYIGQDYRSKDFDNGDRVVIAFFGGIAHQEDFKRTGCLDALQLLTKKYRNVHIGTVGLKLPGMPASRYTFHPGIPGNRWIKEVWPNINCDIAIAPLEGTVFNRCKTNIKWLESAMIPAAFIASNIPPYAGTVTARTGILVENTITAWYQALEKLVLDSGFRQQLAYNARDEVMAAWSIENKYGMLKSLVETIIDDRIARLPA